MDRAVIAATLEAMEKDGIVTITESAYVTMRFTLPRPESVPEIAYPDHSLDICKLVRSTEEALIAAGAIQDHARIVWLRAEKVYAGEGPFQSPSPGCRIKIISGFICGKTLEYGG